MSFDRVSRLRQLLSEAVPVRAERTGAELDSWRQYDHYLANVATPTLERSWRCKAIDEINRIAGWYNYGPDVQRQLDIRGVCSLAALDDAALTEIHERMCQLELCVQTGCGAPDAPPAT